VKVIVLGAGGQLGRDVVALASARGDEVVAFDHALLDLTRKFALPEADLVVNCAAYTAVDRAEAEPELAHAVNATGAGNAAFAAREAGARFVHVSTDYVFDGRADREYQADDRPNPLSVYGRTKLAGEQAVRDAHPEAAIVRTSWVFSERGGFVRTILDLAATRATLAVVDDEIGRPTWARHLAAGCLALANRPGTWHFAGDPPTTRHAFTEAILARARGRLPIATTRVDRTRLADSDRPAPRPMRAVLDVSATQAAGIAIPSWLEGVEAVIASREPR
jgi:dTDP-4-dehydrorhamnose reductase